MTASRTIVTLAAALVVVGIAVPAATHTAATALVALLIASPFLLLARFLSRGGHRGGMARIRAAEARQATRAPSVVLEGDVIDRDGTVVRRAGR